MTERLRQAVDLIATLTEEEQDAIAAKLEADYREAQRIAAQLADAQETDLDYLLAEARREIAEGGARDLDELLRNRRPRQRSADGWRSCRWISRHRHVMPTSSSSAIRITLAYTSIRSLAAGMFSTRCL